MLGFMAVLGGTPERPIAFDAVDDVAAPPRYAQLGGSAAGLFLKLVNEQLQGRIDPRAVTFEAPAGVLLEDVVLTAPGGAPVARVRRARVALSLTALLSGEIAISRLEIDEPQLILEIKDGNLNLLEALKPRKKLDKSKPAEGTFRIDSIVVTGGGFRFNDGTNVTLVFDDINARAKLDVDLAREVVLVDVTDVKVASGNVRLSALDVPLRDISAREVKLLTDRLQITDVKATGLGGRGGAEARVTASGHIDVKSPGLLALNGHVDAAGGAWPDRLDPLSFGTPSVNVDVDVDGVFADPTVSVNGSFGKAELYGYAVDSGVARVVINKSKVVINEGTIAKVGRGSVRAWGEVVLPTDKVASSRLDLRVRVEGAPLATVLAPAKLDTPLRGTMSATAKVTGLAGKDTEILIDGDLSGRSLDLYELHLPPEVDGDVRVLVTPTRVSLQKATVTDPLGGLAVSVAGDIDLKGESLGLSLDVDAEDVQQIVSAIPQDIVAPRARFKATIKGPYKNVVVDGDAEVPAGRAYGVPVERLSAHVRVAGKEIRVERGTAIAAGGAFSQAAPLVFSTGKKGAFSSGTFLVDNADLARITAPDGTALPLAGVIDVEAVLRGPLANPRVLLRASGAGVVVADEQLGSVTTAFVAGKDALTFDSLTTSSPLLRARASGLRLDTSTLRLTGVVDVAALDLSAIENAKSAGLKGFGRGVVAIDGDVRVPGLKADLVVKQLSLKGFMLGDGAVSVGVHPDPAGGPKALAVSLSGSLGWDLGAYDVRASYALARDLVNAEINATDVDLVQLRPFLPKDSIVPFVGVVNGQLGASGPIDRLDAVLKLRIPDLVAELRSKGETLPGNKLGLRPFGAVFADVHLDDGVVDGHLCAFPDRLARSDVTTPCEGPQRLWAVLGGSVHPISGDFSLFIDASADLERIDELVPALGTRDIGLSTWARVTTRLERAATSTASPSSGTIALNSSAATTTTVSAQIKDLIVRPPGAPVLRIARAFALDYADGRAVIGHEPAHFVTARDDFDLVIAAGSSVGADDIDVSVDGDVALSVLKLLTNEVANAAGTAATHLQVKGRFDDGVRVLGTVRPQVGGRLTLRSLGQALVFEEGQIEVSPDANDARQILVSFDAPCGEGRTTKLTGTCPLQAAFGDGRVRLSGNFVTRTSRTEDQTWLQHFDLALAGSSIELKNSLGRAESSFDLALRGDAPAPELSGRVEVNDGFFKKDFQIRNFVLSEAPQRPSTPLWQTLTPIGLGGLLFNVDASMQNVRIKARINAFSVDASLRGELKLARSLKLPAIDGAVEVEEGTVDFPRARFDVVEMQVQFPTSAEGKINPLVHLAARTELQPGAAGNDVEVPIDLTLDGTFDLMQLDLVATDPNRQWSRTELFAYILFGTLPAHDGGLVDAGVDVARQAALRELAAPVSEELTQLAEKQLGLDVNIDVVSGWQLQLGRRLVLEGGFFNQTTTTDSATSSSTTNGTDALRVRLLFFDHLPFGRSLSAEGRIGVTSDLRLSFRLFEQ